MTGTIGGNVITGGSVGISTDEAQAQYVAVGGPSVSDNTVADIQSGSSIGISVAYSTATNNNASNVATGFYLPYGNNIVQANTTMNTTHAYDFDCSSSTVTKNIVNDSQVAFNNSPSLIVGNPLYNVDTIQVVSCP